MRALSSIFVFLLIIGSVTAAITIESINGRTPSAPTNVHPYQGQTIFTIQQKTPDNNALQGFTSPIDPDLSSEVKGSIEFKRVKEADNNAPVISQYYFFRPTVMLSEPESTGPTGGVVVYEVEQEDNTGIMVALILLLSITALFIMVRAPSSIHTKILFTGAAILVIALTVPYIDSKQPTGYTVQEFEQETTFEPATNHVENAFTLTWTHGGPVTFFPEDGENPECSDSVDNADPEDVLIDCADPGCHTDGDETNPLSCDPTDDFEQDMLEYDQSTVLDNQIDVYDIVNWVQYFNGDTTVLVHCTSPTCTNQIGTANCVGDVDPNFDGLLTLSDLDFLQITQLNDFDSRTVPGGGPICFNPV
jgi:hypothetical protein